MGALCSCCKGGGVLEDGQVEMTRKQGNSGQPAQQRRKPTSKAETAVDRAKAEEAKRQAAQGRRKSTSKAETAVDRAKAEEAKRQAGLAAQRRQEAFDKTAVGRAARKVAADLAKPAPRPTGKEPALRWQMG